MKVAFDIGGVLSKYPNELRELVRMLVSGGADIYVITDMHVMEDILDMLNQNGFGKLVHPWHVYSADYTNHGEFCKAILLKQLGIDIFIDDFVGYCGWDSQLGKAPIRFLVMPDPFTPYWDDSWKVKDESDFGRRKFTSLKEDTKKIS